MESDLVDVAGQVGPALHDFAGAAGVDADVHGGGSMVR
jgi:hypothetical protein